MKKFLITGFSGFVSRHFCEYLENNGIHSLIKGIDVHYPDFNQDNFKNIKFDFEKIDLLDKGKIENIIYQFQPDYILHLASFSSVAFSWKDPTISFQNNTNIFLNLLESLRKLDLSTRILSVGSSEQYGNVGKEDLPLQEDHPLNPISPYAVARVSQEMLSKVYAEGFGLDIVMTRSFNHIGPFQKNIFVIPSFVQQLVEIEKTGRKKGNLVAGDLSIIRDFTDVRDVVSAYYQLLIKGQRGDVYNVCSGQGLTLEEIVKKIAFLLNIEVNITVDSKLIRPADNKIIIGSNKKITSKTGWYMQYSLEKSLGDIISYWRLIC